jgi:hypothetical protein
VEARLPAHLRVAGLLRTAQAEGGFGMVLHKGERDGGTILVVTLESAGLGAGRALGTLYERLPSAYGTWTWQVARKQESPDDRAFDDYIARRIAQDADIWVVELTVADGERFIQQSLKGG